MQWDAMTRTQQQIMVSLASGQTSIRRQGRAIVPLEQAGLVSRFKRDYLLRDFSPTIWKLTKEGKAAMLSAVEKRAIEAAWAEIDPIVKALAPDASHEIMSVWSALVDARKSGTDQLNQ